MKNGIIIIMLSAAFSMPSCTQKSINKNVPQKVQTAFNAKFTDATEVAWKMENSAEWEAEFTWNQKEYSANFGADGVWLETEYEINTSEIPSNIHAILDQNFSGYEIKKSEIANNPKGTSYEIEIEMGEEAFEVSIDEHGNLTRKNENNED